MACSRSLVLSTSLVLGLLLAQHSRALPDPSSSGPGGDALDLGDLRTSAEAARRALFPTPEGHAARHSGQRWTARFDGRGFELAPDAGDWSFGLELVRWGFAGRERAIARDGRAHADGTRLEHERDDSLVEWYVHGARGLEHGFDVLARPEGEGPLILTLAVRGGFAPVVLAGGRDARFVDASGTCVLTYTGLLARDADGRELAARLEAGGAELTIQVDERGARYPLSIDPLVQQAYLKASNTGAGDRFGSVVAVSGDTAVVGAFAEDSSAIGVNGDQASNAATNAGAAYVFVRSGTAWTQQAYLKASNTDALDQFGWSVAISGDTIVVGARNEASAATGVDGNQADDSLFGAGAAYVFVRSGTTWTQQAYLKASNTGSSDLFGHAVAISGDTIVVASEREDSAASGVDGDQASNAANDSGAVYVFVRNGTTWSQQAYFKASNTEAEDLFGFALSISGDTVVVGSRYESSDATGVNGSQANNDALRSGAAYVFVRNGTTWSQQAYLKASNTDPNDEFASSVSVSGARLVAGAWGESSPSSGVNGSQTNSGSQNSGAAYVFSRTGTTWSQEAYLKASTNGPNDSFGLSVAIDGDQVLVGAQREDSAATGVDGDQASNALSNSGAAYLFARGSSGWSQRAYLKASNPGVEDQFGWWVALSGDVGLVGARNESSSATGVNGDGGNDAALEAGAAYAFDLDEPFASFCPSTIAACPCSNVGLAGRGCDNAQATGGVLLTATGTPALNDVVLSGSGYPPAGTPGVVVIRSPAVEPSPVAFGDGIRCVGALGLVRLGATNALGGTSTHPLNHGAGPGTFHYQLWYRNTPASFCDPAAAFNLSNGLSILWP